MNIRYSQCKRPGECDVASVEQMSVMESLMEVDPINKAYMAILFSNILAFASFAVSLRMKWGGGSCVESVSHFVQEIIDEW